MQNNKIIYSLTVEDVQKVANEEFERNLSVAEIEKIKNIIDDKINWFDAIAEAINDIDRG